MGSNRSRLIRCPLLLLQAAWSQFHNTDRTMNRHDARIHRSGDAPLVGSSSPDRDEFRVCIPSCWLSDNPNRTPVGLYPSASLPLPSTQAEADRILVVRARLQTVSSATDTVLSVASILTLVSLRYDVHEACFGLVNHTLPYICSKSRRFKRNSTAIPNSPPRPTPTTPT